MFRRRSFRRGRRRRRRRRHRREHFVVGHGEVVVAHQRVARRVVAVVRVRQVAVAVHVHVAVVGDQQVGSGPEYRAYPADETNVHEFMSTLKL